VTTSTNRFTKLSSACVAVFLTIANVSADETRLRSVVTTPTVNTLKVNALKEVAPPSVEPTDFADNIHAQLAGNVDDYAFVIAENGLLAEQGQDGEFTVNTDVNVMSVSKHITAIAALQLMEKLGLEPYDPISDWLPASWDPGNGFGPNGITFFDLLTHRTGIKQTIKKLDAEDPVFEALSTNTYEGVQAIVEHGIYPEFVKDDEDGYGKHKYKNANFKIAAILIWQMALATGDLSSNAELSADVDSALGYQHYVRQNVLQPAGVDGYCSTEGSTSGVLTCGPKGWRLSAMDLAAVAAHREHGNLLSPQTREWMDELKMGWREGSNSSERPNRYWHDGLSKPNKHRCIMKLPGALDATLVMTTDVRNPSRSACGVLHIAFEDAQKVQVRTRTHNTLMSVHNPKPTRW